jgi:hypothetical protein
LTISVTRPAKKCHFYDTAVPIGKVLAAAPPCAANLIAACSHRKIVAWSDNQRPYRPISQLKRTKRLPVKSMAFFLLAFFTLGNRKDESFNLKCIWTDKQQIFCHG